LKDVYVTDHSTPTTKYLSKSDEEDEELLNYQKAMEDYNESTSGVFKTPKKSKYPKSSLMQRLFDPFAESTRDENGTIIYTVEEKEL
jgi:hypothetical protein